MIEVDALVDTSDSEASTQKMFFIGSRMRQAREYFGFSQKEMADKLGVSKRGIQDNETRNRVPGGEVINGFVFLGINANWLLTGEGPMLLADLKKSSVTGALDSERLLMSIQAVEEGLSASRRSMASEKKAELIAAVYELLEEPSVAKERVLKLVKLAA